MMKLTIFKFLNNVINNLIIIREKIRNPEIDNDSESNHFFISNLGFFSFAFFKNLQIIIR
jgi:hypothetical protein